MCVHTHTYRHIHTQIYIWAHVICVIRELDLSIVSKFAPKKFIFFYKTPKKLLTHTHTLISVCTHTYKHLRAHTLAHAHTLTYYTIHTYAYSHTYKYTHIHKHLYKQTESTHTKKEFYILCYIRE